MDPHEESMWKLQGRQRMSETTQPAARPRPPAFALPSFPSSVLNESKRNRRMRSLRMLVLFIHVFPISSVCTVDFLFNSFKPTDLILVGDARMESSVVRLTNDSNQFSIGRAFFPTRIRMATDAASNRTLASFSTSFVFSILPEIPSSPGFGLAFVLSNTTSPPDAISGQYFGVFSNSTRQTPGPLLAVEFDTGQNPEFNDPDGNHVGIDLNYIESVFTHAAGYYRAPANGSEELEFIPLDMRSGRNIRAWIEMDGPRFQINVTIAPAEDPRPSRPLVSYTDAQIANYVSPEMFVGFSASKVKWVEAQRVLAWSFSNTGAASRELNMSDLPVFLPQSPPRASSHSAGLISGLSAAASVALAFVCLCGLYYYFCRYRKKSRRIRGEGKEDDRDRDEEEDWEVQHWPRRFAYEDLWNATDGFSRGRLLGFGGFGRVYRGVLPASISRGVEEDGEEKEEIAVKCVSHDSKQGFREFMAEVSSLGRLQHKSLVPMRGWCRKGTELMLVYEYMPNGSLGGWIFPAGGGRALGWAERRRVLEDVAEGLLYLHEGWEQVVLHRDVKSSNILLDAAMRGRLGDFGLAKLYQHGQAPCRTRVVGTLGYMAPELAQAPAPTVASDVYSFGVVALEVCCGRRPIQRAGRLEEEDWLLVEWAREMYGDGRLQEAADGRMELRRAEREDVELVLKLGLACCHPVPEQRPTMREVVGLLSGEEAGRPALDVRG